MAPKLRHPLLLSILSLFACATSQGRGQYPAEWWKKIPESDRQSWEVLPQDAKPGEVIVSKRTELGVFSNLTAVTFRYDGETYPSLEALWQMMKYPELDPRDPRHASKDWPYTRAQVMKLTGFDAKRAGDRGTEILKKLGIDWVTYKGERIRSKDNGGPGSLRHYAIILEATREKIRQNPELRRLLVQTRGLKLRMDHDPGNPQLPSYQTHEILMKIREEL